MNLFAKFKETVNTYPNKIALKYKKEGKYKVMTFKELFSRIESLMTAFDMFGINKGDRIAILSENRPQWVIADFAIMGLGAINVPIHAVLTSKYIEYILNDSQCEILLLSNQKQMDKIIDVKDKLPHIKSIICFDECKIPENFPFRVFSMNNILNLSKGGYAKNIEIEPEHICSIVYTSGTTGEPTGVMLTHKNFISNIEAANKAVPTESKDILLSVLPLSHVFERVAGYYTPLFNGATIAYAEGIKTISQNLAEIKPTILCAVPRIYEKFDEKIWETARNSGYIKHKLFYWALKQKPGTLAESISDYLVYKKIRSKLGGHIKFCICGAASLNPHIAKFFHKVGILIIEGYGLTENSPIVSCNQQDKYKFGTAGKVLNNLEVKIDANKEILVKGPSVMKGYLNQDEKTKNAKTEDGWLKTGDLGFMDSEGFLTIIGRIKEMIILNNGKNVVPEKLENLLNLDRFIYQSAIFGHQKPYLSALIVPDYNELTTYAKEQKISFNTPKDLLKNEVIHKLYNQIVEKQLKEMPDYEKIRKIYLIDREFSIESDEMTPTLKLRRKVIEGHYKNEIELLY